MNLFHSPLAGLSVLGFVEFGSAAYQRFDEMGQTIVMDANLREAGVGLEGWTRMKPGAVRTCAAACLFERAAPRQFRRARRLALQPGRNPRAIRMVDPQPHTYEGLGAG